MTRTRVDRRFAGLARRTSVSPIARTLEIVDRTPGMVSFACGNPATEALSVDAIARAADDVLRLDTARALQYVRPRGVIQDALIEYLGRDGIHVDATQILPTTGAIQALSLVTHSLVEPGDVVITEWPTYPVNLATFKAHGARTIGVPMDADGMRVDALERLLGTLDAPPRLIYVIPDAQNPTGITMSEDRRCQLVRVSRSFGVPILEDVPYRGIRYRGEPAPTVTALARDADASSMLVGSFAKSVAPGLRVGYLVADPELVDTCVRLKQGEDFCSPGLNHLIIERLLRDGEVQVSIERMCAVQAPKLDAMLEALESELGDLAEVHWTHPVGGLFIWMSLPETVDTDRVLERCIEEKVAFIPGRYFYPDARVGDDGRALDTAAPTHELRLNFSDPTLDAIPTGIATLSRVIRSML